MLQRNDHIKLPTLARSPAVSVDRQLSRRMWYFYLCVAAILLAFGIAPGRIATPDAHLRLAQARNFVEHGTLTVPDGVGNPMHGNLVTAPDGRRFSVYNIGQIALFIPLAWAATHWPPIADLHTHYIAEFLAAFLGPAVHFLTAILLISIFELLGADRRRAAVVGFVYAFATFGLPHAMDGYEHPYEALGIACSVYLILKAQQYSGTEAKGWRLIALYAAAGASIGAAALFRNSVWVAVPGLLFLTRTWSGRASFMAATVPFIFIILVYNYLRFGSPLETGYAQAWQIANPQLKGASGFSLLAVPGHLAGLWFSWGKGMLIYSPILLALIAIPFSGTASAYRRLFVSMILICLLYNGLYSANFAWHGSEWCWGPRYLIPTLVPLVILLGLSIPRTPVLRGAWATLLCVSVFFQLVGMSVSYQRPLLSMYQADPKSFAEGRVLYSMDHSPLLRQFVALKDVTLQVTQPRHLSLFISPGPWRNEARPASIDAMLQQSIDLNAFNIWWIRACYFPFSAALRSLAFLMGLSTLLLGVALLWHSSRRGLRPVAG